MRERAAAPADDADHVRRWLGGDLLALRRPASLRGRSAGLEPRVVMGIAGQHQQPVISRAVLGVFEASEHIEVRAEQPLVRLLVGVTRHVLAQYDGGCLRANDQVLRWSLAVGAEVRLLPIIEWLDPEVSAPQFPSRQLDAYERSVLHAAKPGDGEYLPARRVALPG